MFYRQLRNELWKLFGKKRTYIGFGVFLVVQNIMLVAFHYTNMERWTGRLIEGNGYLAMEYISALTVSLIMLLPQNLFLMPLYTCLVGGDLVAKESEEGSLRMILSRPITRFRLLAVKWWAGLIFCVILVAALGLMAVCFARMWFPWKGMFVFLPEPDSTFSLFSAAEGLRLYALAQLFLCINATTMMTLAFMFGCFNMKPAAATVLALSLLLFNLVMESIPAFQQYRQFLLIYHMRAWTVVFADPIQWTRVGGSLLVLGAFNFTCLAIGMTGFQLRDIKS